MVAKKSAETPQEIDSFVETIQKSIEDMLKWDKDDLPAKERNALIANAIKFLAIKLKVEGSDDGGSFFGGED